MATNVVPSKRLENHAFHVCAACIYGKTTKLNRMTNTAISINEAKLVELVGDCVSGYALVSSTPGIIAHM